MRATDLGSLFRVYVFKREIDAFADNWPCSGLRGLRGVAFEFEKRNGDLVGVDYRNGSSDDWDGPALLALSQDAQEYGHEALRLDSEGKSA